MRMFDPKDPAESVTLTLDFTNDLLPGETLTDTPTATIVMFRGSDPAVGSMLSGSPQIYESTMVLQVCTGGKLFCGYAVVAVCMTSLGRELAEGGILLIKSAALM